MPLARKQGLNKTVVAYLDTPRLFAFAKTHKPTPSLRPILDKARSSTKILENKVHQIVAEHLKDYPLSVRDSKELIDTVVKTQITENTHVTVFDFEALYPSIKLQPCFCTLRDILLDKYNLSVQCKQVLELMHLMCYNSIFKFNNTTYLQKRGAPMGNPFSGDLCELVLWQLEREVINSFTYEIILYWRYTDDVIVFWKSEPRINNFLDSVNNNSYGLTLKIDQMSTASVNFLGITIRLN
ncbi:uncharacterized protein [Centruroides vittatus]|uniref:uncharacterized protein n=1 Tax=Centruroides vittatus TaxID=120091 RepID=UPI00350EFEEB